MTAVAVAVIDGTAGGKYFTGAKPVSREIKLPPAEGEALLKELAGAVGRQP